MVVGAGDLLLYQQGGYVVAVLVSALIVTLGYAILYHLLARLGANEILSAALVLWAAGADVAEPGRPPAASSRTSSSRSS